MKQTGSTLTGFLIAVLLAGIMIIAMGHIYVNSKSSYTYAERYARTQESGRISAELFAYDARMAGFRFCGPANVVNRTNDNMVAGNGRIEGWDSAPNPYFQAGEVKDGTDMVAIHYAEDVSAQVMTPYMTTESSALHVNPDSDIVKGDILFITDCTVGDVFQVTGSEDPQISGTVVHSKGSVTQPGNWSHNLSTVYSGKSFIFRAQTVVYFVSPDGVFSRLRMERGKWVTDDLAGHINDFQVRYVTNDKGAYSLRSAEDVYDWSLVEAAAFVLITDFPANPLSFAETVKIRNK